MLIEQDHPDLLTANIKAVKAPTAGGLSAYAGLTTIDPVAGTNVAAPAASGELYVVSGLVVIKGKPVTGIAFRIGSTPQSVGTNFWYALVDMNLNVLAKTAQDTTASGGTVANTTRRLDFATPYQPTTTQEVYAGIVSVGTIATTIGLNTSASVSGGLNSGSNRIAGRSTAALTDPASLGATIVAPATGNLIPLAFLV